MAEEHTSDTQEKSHPATPRKIEQLRTQGQVPRSQDLTATGVLVVGAIAMALLGSGLAEGLMSLMRRGFTRMPVESPARLFSLLESALLEGVVLLVPLLAVVTVVALLAPVALGGWVLSAQAIQPKWDKLDPIQGLRKRVFTVRGLMEMLKAAAKFVLIAGVGAAVLWLQADHTLSLARQPFESGLADAAGMLAGGFIALSAAMILIAVIDVPFQIWNFARQNRMSFEEVKRELRNEEGAPELRAKVKALQREIAQRRMMESIPTADVIITNPTHYAVALAYDPADREAAPRLVAAGVELVSWQIRNRAQRHRIPIIASPALARAIFHSTEFGQEIPLGLYTAVAVVLRYAYRLRGRHGFERAEPPPADLPIPPEYRVD